MYLKMKKKVIEPMIFDSDNMKSVYKKYNIELTNNTLIKDNKSINFENHFNNTNAKQLSNNKIKTSYLLKKNNIPVCNFYEWDNDISTMQNMKIINNKLNYPLVVKYIYGERGNDVYTDINNKEYLLNSINKLKKQKKNEIMVEEQIEGNKYRIMVLNGQIIFACHHDAPKIIGNGNSTVKQLINNYSKNTGLQSISIINEELIKQQGYKLNDVLEKNKVISVTNIISIINGGKEKYIEDSEIHPSNIAMFQKVNNVIGLNFSGIDYISNSLKEPYFVNGKILEVNPGPGFSITQQNNKSIIEKWINAAFN
jgi:cyanophycin synthetase